LAITLTPSKRKVTKTKTNEIEKARKRIESVDQDEKVAFVIYGRNKTGKTKFACDSKLKTLVIDCNERGTITVRKMAPRVQRYRVRTWEDMDPIYWLLRSGDHEFEVIVIDTVTSLAALCMKWVLKEQDDRDFNREPKTPDQRSWGKMGEHITDVITKFRNLPYHVVFTAQEKETFVEEEDGTSTSLIHPELSPRPRSTLLSAVSLIGRIYVAETVDDDGKKKYERRMLIGPHPKYSSGGRFEQDMKRIERDPTLGKFLNKIYGVKKYA
jgi:phage nucleotide-binding protein